MRKTIIDEQIKLAKDNIKKGSNKEEMQNKLKEILMAYKEYLNLTEEEVKRYLIKIEALSKNNLINLNISKKLYTLAPIGLSLVISMSFTGCVSKSKQIEMQQQQLEEANEKLNEMAKELEEMKNKEVVDMVAITKAPTQAPTVVPTKKPEKQEKLDLSKFIYDGTDEEKVVLNINTFINDSLAKGLYTRDTKANEEVILTFALNEDNKKKAVTDFVNLFYYLNASRLPKDTYTIYQNTNLGMNDYMESVNRAFKEITNDAYTVLPNTMLSLENLFTYKNDYEYVNKCYQLLALINQTKGDERQNYIEQMKNFKRYMLTSYQNKEIDLSSQALECCLKFMKIADKFTAGYIFNDESMTSSLKQIYLSSLKEEDRNEIDLKNFNPDINDLEEAFNSRGKRIVYANRKKVKEIPHIGLSYNEVIENINNNVNLDSYNFNPYSKKEWLNYQRFGEFQTPTQAPTLSDEEKIKARDTGLSEGEKAAYQRYQEVAQALDIEDLNYVDEENLNSNDYDKIYQYYYYQAYMKVKEELIQMENEITVYEEELEPVLEEEPEEVIEEFDFEKIKKKAIKKAKKDLKKEAKKVSSAQDIKEVTITEKPSDDCEDYDTVYNYFYTTTYMEERWNLVMEERFPDLAKLDTDTNYILAKNEELNMATIDEKPYLSTEERNQVIDEVVKDYAKELYDVYFSNDDTLEKTRKSL